MNTKHFIAGVAVGTLLALHMPSWLGTAAAQDPQEFAGPIPEDLPPLADICPPCPPCPDAEAAARKAAKAAEALRAIEAAEEAAEDADAKAEQWKE
jgi:hypothetical protein